VTHFGWNFLLGPSDRQNAFDVVQAKKISEKLTAKR